MADLIVTVPDATRILPADVIVPAARIPDLPEGGGGGATTLDGLTDVATAGQAAGKALISDGTNWAPSSAAVVLTNDARLSDARTPSAHTHPAANISDSTTAGRALVTAADASAQRTALGLGGAAVLAVGTTAGTVAAGDDSRMTNSRTPTTHAASHDIGGSDGLGGIYGPGFAVNTVAASGSTETLPATHPAHNVTMDQNCTFTFPTVTGGFSFMLRLAGAFTPTFPASVKWSSGAAPTYTTPAVYTFTTFDGGTTWKGVQAGRAFS